VLDGDCTVVARFVCVTSGPITALVSHR